MSLKYILFFVSTTLCLFGMSNFADVIGIHQRTVLSFTLLLLYCLKYLNKKRFNYTFDKSYILLLIIGFLIVAFQLVLGRNYFKSILSYCFLPCIISYFFERLDLKQTNILRKAVLLFYVTNCIMAIIERITSTVYIGYNTFTDFEIVREEDWEFRSSALLGHPLANTIVMVPMLLCIMASSMQWKNKMFCYFLGIIAMFCFNARSGILMALICSVPAIVDNLKEQDKKERRRNIVLFSLCFVFAGYYIINSDLSGRLFKLAEETGFLNDSSSLARLEILSFSDYLNTFDLLWGNPDSYNRLLITMNLVGIENGIISILIYQGVILGIPLLCIMWYFNWKRFAEYKNTHRWMIFIGLYGIGLTNPHLQQGMVWIYILLCSFAFNPQYRNYKTQKI